MLTTSFVYRLRALCDTYRALIVADEVLTGCGRTGLFFAYQHYGDMFVPDYVFVGKGLLFSSIVMVQRPFTMNGTEHDTTYVNVNVGDADRDSDDDNIDDDDDGTHNISRKRKRKRSSSSSSSSSSTASSPSSLLVSTLSTSFPSPYNADALFKARDEFREHVTFECNAVLFLQAAVLLERIHSGDLMTDIRTTGQHIMDRLQLI